jgi:manganese transport protein
MPRDPYQLDASQVEDPPATLGGRLRMLGPGFILTATVVGSGELIATTTLGAKVGFAALWVILLSCAVKVALQLEFGRHTILHGETCLAAFNRLPGPAWRGANWTTWYWLAVQPLKMLQLGGIIGSVAMVMNIAAPVISVAAWCWITAVVAALLVSNEAYRPVERTCMVMLALFTATTIVSVASLQWTPYAVTGGDLAEGFGGTIPASAIVLLIGAFGLTGVGGDEIMQYTYWLIEKGYAAKTGPPQPGDPAWTERARGWIRVMYLDAFASMLVYTIATAAFYVLGAAVLNARGETPQGYEMIDVMAGMYTESLGPWARGVFLVGALVVLFSTVYSALAAWMRVFADAAGKLQLIDFYNLAARRKLMLGIAWAFPLAWATIFLSYKEPVYMVALGGVGTATILLIIIVAAIHFRYRQTPAELRPSPLYDAALWLSIASIATIAVYGVATKLGGIPAS